MKDFVAGHGLVDAEQWERYARQLILPWLGMQGQQRIRQASVLVVGAGGLGVPVLQYLAAAGIGLLGIVDGDKVHLSNLHRQVLYATDEVGLPKAEVAARRIKALNPEVAVCVRQEYLRMENAMQIIADFDVVADCSDNFPTRYLINDVCVKSGKPFVSGAVHQLSGQVAMFNVGNGATYRCLFPSPPPAHEVPSCSDAGILGTVAGLAGVLMAHLLLQWIVSPERVPGGQLLYFTSFPFELRTLSFSPDESLKKRIVEQPLPTQSDYECWCKVHNENQAVKQISLEQLRQWQLSESVTLVDVREEHERDSGHLGGLWIPFEELMRHEEMFRLSAKVVFYCSMGVRSYLAIQRLQERYGLTNLYNLRGGLKAYPCYQD